MKICVGISGSIAAYRSPDFVKRLVASEHAVKVILTKGGAEFVSARVLETFSQNPVVSPDIFHSSHFATDHISSARWADVFVIYGATADFLAKMAHGLGDDFLSVQLLAFTGPVVIAPAMNPAMWQHPALRQNVEILRQRKNIFVGPIAGVVACGEEGVGHIASDADIAACVASLPAL